MIGTSARQRRIPWPCLTPRQLAAQLSHDLANAPQDTRIAVLFGREDRGLTNDELRRCNLHVSVPTNPEYGVLNVASAVQLISYELRLALLGMTLTCRNPVPAVRLCRYRKCSGMSRRLPMKRYRAFWITWKR